MSIWSAAEILGMGSRRVRWHYWEDQRPKHRSTNVGVGLSVIKNIMLRRKELSQYIAGTSQLELDHTLRSDGVAIGTENAAVQEKQIRNMIDSVLGRSEAYH